MKYQVASNIKNDTISLECYRDDGSLALVISYDDESRNFEIETFGGPIGVQEMNKAMMTAEIKLLPIDDQSNSSLNLIIQTLNKAATSINDSTENRTTKDYLLAVASWLEDCDGYYNNTGKKNDVEFREILRDAIQAGLIYE